MEKNRPLLHAIERLYRKPIAEVIADLYGKYGNFADVAHELGTTRQTLYRWVGSDTLRQIRERYEAGET